jgi:hypothetical protein
VAEGDHGKEGEADDALASSMQHDAARIGRRQHEWKRILATALARQIAANYANYTKRMSYSTLANTLNSSRNSWLFRRAASAGLWLARDQKKQHQVKQRMHHPEC